MSVDILDRVYDAYTGEMGQQLMRGTQRRIHWMCSCALGNSVLDVGCSKGLVPILLGREGKSAFGIDSSSSAIRAAEQHLLDEPVSIRKRVAFIEADFLTHAFGEQRFDSVVLGDMLPQMLYPERLVAAAAHVLNEGARLIVTVPFGVHDHVERKHTFYLLEPYRLLSSHFDITEIVILGKWLGLVGTRRAAPVAPTAEWSEQQLRQLEAAFAVVEQGLMDELGVLGLKLDDVSTKYRASSEDVSRLKREIAHQEQERRVSELARSRLEAQLASLQAGAASAAPSPELLELRKELTAERETRHARELGLARLEERLSNTEQFRQLELGVRDAELARSARSNAQLEGKLLELSERLTQQAEQARLVLDAEREAAQRSAQHAARLAERVEVQEGSLAALQVSLHDAATEHAREITDLQRELVERKRSVEELVQRLAALQAETEDRVSVVTDLADQLAVARAQLLEQSQLSVELKAARARLEVSLPTEPRSADEEHVDNSPQLPDVQKRASVLQSELTQQRLAHRTLQQKSEQLRQQLLASKQAERKASALLERERRDKAALERQVVQTRNTLSFQLGYELIHGFKSRSALLALPKNLWQLQQEAVRRRKHRHDRDLKIRVEPVAIPVQHATPAAPATTLRVESFAPTQVTSRAPAVPPDLTGDLSQLRVACIHDEFTFAAYSPECRLLQLTPAAWRQELEAFQPQLLFIESAWRGKGDLWNRKIAHRSQELAEIVAWCQQRGIPTAFWNKEDPVHFRTFLNTAKLFDVVFTTDADCIHRYRRSLGHDRVHLLPFAFQPRAHSPIEKYQRKEAICFAGAYYARYPERQVDLATFARSMTDAPRLEIYDRNYGKDDPDYKFPDEYQPLIVGTLSFEDIDRAYKGYRYALNLNSIKESQTMFARRVFELLGSNTITVSNFSRGVRLMFGDLVVTTDHGERALERLRDLARDESRSRRFRLAGLRKVLREHTYEHRLRLVASRVWNRELPDTLPAIKVLGFAESASDVAAVLASFERQAYPNKSLLLVAPRALTASSPGAPNVKLLAPEQAGKLVLGDVEGSHVAALSCLDHYGAHYLLDLALGTRYSDAVALGKVTRYAVDPSGEPQLLDDGAQYRGAPSVPIRAALVRRAAIAAIPLLEWLGSLATQRFVHPDCIALDEFNYCEGGCKLAGESASRVDDLERLNHGLSMDLLLESCSAGRVQAHTEPQSVQIPAARLATLFKPGPAKPIRLQLEGDQLLVESSLPDETHEYLYANQAWSPSALGFPGSGRFHLDATPGLNIQMALLFLDEQKQRLGHKLCHAGRNETVALAEGTAYVQLGMRVYGSGSAKVSALLLDHVREAPETLFGSSDYLLLTNHYPSDNDLYRNGFVHRRVLEYKKHGTRVDVFRMRAGEKLNYHEFDGVDVINGGSEALTTLLRSNRYKAVLVHFLDQRMWAVLKQHAGDARVLIWVHGAEIQAWHRRDAHYSSAAQLDAAKADSARRSTFWREVTSDLPDGAKLIFVSKHFAREVMTDLEVDLAPERYQVIHNVIDTSLFRYEAKAAEQRKRILSIRPHTSRIYGNDITVAAILELAKRPCFTDLTFHLVGDGPLFEETVAPLRNFGNVQLDRGFLAQSAIAELHRSYGVFLCATRGDTQGVSRDEAMSSGLVPITNRVGAIPEFVDQHSGIIAESEDTLGLAAGVQRLYEDPALFQALSGNAAQRVRSQTGPFHTTDRELRLILGTERS